MRVTENATTPNKQQQNLSECARVRAEILFDKCICILLAKCCIATRDRYPFDFLSSTKLIMIMRIPHWRICFFTTFGHLLLLQLVVSTADNYLMYIFPPTQFNVPFGFHSFSLYIGRLLRPFPHLSAVKIPIKCIHFTFFTPFWTHLFSIYK